MLSIVWNITRDCCWNCKFCCVDANYVNPQTNACNTHGNEISIEQKKEIIDKISTRDVRLDMSGGEIFINDENFDVIRYASNKIGRSNLGVTTSGAFLNPSRIKSLSELISDFEVTLDCAPYQFYKMRPIGYHEYGSMALLEMSKYDVTTGAQTVVTLENIDMLFELHDWLELNNIKEWSLLRFFPVGRGENYKSITPSSKEYAEIIEKLKRHNEGKNLQLNFQYLLPNHEKFSLKCRAVKKSIGILPNGDVTACFWSLEKGMKINGDKFQLGNILNSNLEDIMNSDNSCYWQSCEHQCKFFMQDELWEK